jgi:hypothetical protein
MHRTTKLSHTFCFFNNITVGESPTCLAIHFAQLDDQQKRQGLGLLDPIRFLVLLMLDPTLFIFLFC